MRVPSLALGAQLLLAAVLQAGAPLIDNVDLQSRTLQGNLDAAVESWSAAAREASWLGWHAPILQKNQVLCCHDRGGRGWQSVACPLAGTHRHFTFSSDRLSGLPASENLVVLLQAAGGELVEIQVYSDNCRLDAGGQEVVWLEGVAGEESAAYLGGVAESNAVAGDEALMALALHAAPVAARRLADIARQSSSADRRGEALFWLSHTAAPEASEILLEALAEDPDPEVREEAIFALGMLPDGEGLPLLMEIFRDPDQPSSVREEAFFWYVQSGDDEALDLIVEILSD